MGFDSLRTLHDFLHACHYSTNLYASKCNSSPVRMLVTVKPNLAVLHDYRCCLFAVSELSTHHSAPGRPCHVCIVFSESPGVFVCTSAWYVYSTSPFTIHERTSEMLEFSQLPL